MSKEHVLRAKFKPVMDPDSDSYHVASIDPVTGEVKVDTMNGSLWSLTVRKVCTDCNNGWMNVNVEQPIEDELLSMMTGGAATLSQEKTAGLALWAAKTVIVMAAAKDEEDGLPLALRRTVMDTLAPPAVGCAVLMGRVDGDGSTAYGGTFANPRLDMTGEEAYRVQETRIIVGSLVFYVSMMIRKHPGVTEVYTFALPKGTLGRMKQIWPNPTPVSWPEDFPEPLTQDEAMTLHDVLEQHGPNMFPDPLPARPMVFGSWPPNPDRPDLWIMDA